MPSFSDFLKKTFSSKKPQDSVRQPTDHEFDKIANWGKSKGLRISAIGIDKKTGNINCEFFDSKDRWFEFILAPNLSILKKRQLN